MLVGGLPVLVKGGQMQRSLSLKARMHVPVALHGPIRWHRRDVARSKGISHGDYDVKLAQSQVAQTSQCFSVASQSRCGDFRRAGGEPRDLCRFNVRPLAVFVTMYTLQQCK
jgi:hypothetical protein